MAALKESGGELELFIGWFIDGNGGDTFPPELLGQASRLGIALAFDVYGTWERCEAYIKNDSLRCCPLNRCVVTLNAG
ncbi:hypothetical protein QA646_00255 [Rhizobium sp. CB3090]|uniref:hypothetical protein n=1 Tax=Rhizobium sp. CB3090 TaxID=3039156 RepID=UPI0024B23E40|nr:hypothetical protein [Rhizobium sp. CB3090]WFU09338.1 hypothetical protein QA646_00255 [Rhizobium sp. CB3090]